MQLVRAQVQLHSQAMNPLTQLSRTSLLPHQALIRSVPPPSSHSHTKAPSKHSHISQQGDARNHTHVVDVKAK